MDSSDEYDSEVDGTKCEQNLEDGVSLDENVAAAEVTERSSDIDDNAPNGNAIPSTPNTDNRSHPKGYFNKFLGLFSRRNTSNSNISDNNGNNPDRENEHASNNDRKNRSTPSSVEEQFAEIVQNAREDASSSQSGPITRSRRRNALISSSFLSSAVRNYYRRSNKRSNPEGSAGRQKIRKTRFSHTLSHPRSTSIRETINDRRSLVHQQNQAYQESLKADQEKARIKAEKEKEEKEAIEEEHEKIKKIQERKLKAREDLPEEPSDEVEGIITLAIRFPSGTIIRRNFLRTDTLHTLRNFVISCDETPLIFQVIRYPNEEIPLDDTMDFITFEEYGFKRKEVLHLKTRSENEINKSGDQSDNLDL